MNSKLILIIALFTIISCSKLENSIQQPDNNLNKDKASSSREKGSNTDSITYFLNMDKPTRDAILFKNSGGIMPATKVFRTGDRKPTPEEELEIASLVNPTYPNYHCCNNICLTIPEDPYGFYSPFTDEWKNNIKFIGRYGSDPRQMYYVYTPNNVNVNSKIVVLVHGGGWISGPDPDQVNGWGATYAPDQLNSTTNKKQYNIVKNLLSQGYVVVSVLYRLVHYGDNSSDILSTPITVIDQVDDIESAVVHIRTSFPSCLWQTPLNADNIQIMGESAGGNLALLFAYTRANTQYIKSVVSVAGPTNMNQYANFVKSKNLIHPFINQSCGTSFAYDNFNNTNFTHFPFYGFIDPPVDYNNMIITRVTNFSNISCGITSINIPWLIPIITPTSNPPLSTTVRRADFYKLAQSCVRQNITNPLTDAAFTAISPRFQLKTIQEIYLPLLYMEPKTDLFYIQKLQTV